jgi:hypothetical protein
MSIIASEPSSNTSMHPGRLIPHCSACHTLINQHAAAAAAAAAVVQRLQREAAARLAAEQEAAVAAAAAAAEQEAARRLELWHQALQQQSRYHGRQEEGPTEGPAATPAPASAAAAAAAAEVRSIRQEQDAEYKVSLAQDVAKQQERQTQLKQQRRKAKLVQLRSLLRERLSPEPAGTAAAATAAAAAAVLSDVVQSTGDEDSDAQDLLTIRVRLPNGSNQQRK